MKKIMLAITALVCMVLSVVLVSCKEKNTELDRIKDMVSHIQYDLYLGKSDNMSVNLVDGQKETQFIADGKVGELVNYCTLTIIPKKIEMHDKKFTFKIIGTNGEATGEMSKNLLGASFSAEISDYKNLGDIKSVIISWDGKNDDIQLTNKTIDCITSDKAIEYAYNAIKDALKEDFIEGKFCREVYVKFINDKNNTDSEYFWYVSMIKANDNFYSVLINPTDGSIVSKKI